MSYTHRVSRITSAPESPPGSWRIFFNPIGRSLEWDEGTPEAPGSPQDVPAEVAVGIERDSSLAPHFRCERLAPPAPTEPGPEEGAGKKKALTKPAA